jgi:hypothetical protein
MIGNIIKGNRLLFCPMSAPHLVYRWSAAWAHNMRLPPAMKAVLSNLARQRATDATTLARIWLAERLEGELKAG